MDLVLRAFEFILVNGLIVGVVYAIIALGYTMVYGVLQLINFAHSEVFVTGAVVGFEVFTHLSRTGLNGYLQLLIALFAGMLVSGLLNVVIERLAYRPLRNAPKLVPLISAIGVSFILQDVLRLIEGVQGRFDLATPLPAEFTKPLPFNVLGVGLQMTDAVLVVVTVLSLAALNYLVNFTRLGRAIRATAQDRTTAGLMGIDANRIIALTFLIGGALGGLGGVLYAMKYSVNAYSGTIPGIKAFTAAVLGGIGSIPGAVVGGLVLGVLEQLIGQISIFGSLFKPLAFLGAIKAEYKDVGAFIALILILIIKPAGLLGRSNTEKV